MLWMLRPHVQVWLVPWLSSGGFKNWGPSLMFGTDGRNLVFSQWGSSFASQSAVVLFLVGLRDAAHRAAFHGGSLYRPQAQSQGLFSVLKSVALGEAFADCVEPFPWVWVLHQQKHPLFPWIPWNPNPLVPSWSRESQPFLPTWASLAFSHNWTAPIHLTPTLAPHPLL